MGESEKEGEAGEGASFYKGMINGNSTGNKTKHPSCCQSNEASTFQDAGTRQCLALGGSTDSQPLLLRVNSPIFPGVSSETREETDMLGLVRGREANLSQLSSSASPSWDTSGQT